MAATITLHLGDITSDGEADAIVNAANSSLLGGGGAATDHSPRRPPYVLLNRSA